MHRSRRQKGIHVGEALDEGAVEGAAGRPLPLGRAQTGGVAQEVHQTVVSTGHAAVPVTILSARTALIRHLDR